MKHFVTVYGEDGKVWIEAWLQVNILWWSFCLWNKRIPLSDEDYQYIRKSMGEVAR